MAESDKNAGNSGKPRPKPVPGKPIYASGEEDSGEVASALLLGIDLGTSRSAIVGSNGVRKMMESYVGYPKDAVSKKMLKADIIYGRHALENRLALDLYRPLEKGVIKYTDDDGGSSQNEHDKNLLAATHLIKHLVNLVEPSRDEVLYGVVGVPSQATIKNKKAILEACKEVLDSVMIVSEPFAVAYGMEMLADVMVIDIGAGTTDLARMHGTVPADEDQVSLKIAGDAIDQKLHDLIMEKYPTAQLTVNMCKKFKEQYGYVSDTKDAIVVKIPVDGKPTDHDITQLMRDACSIIVQPILDGIHKLVSTFNPEFQEKLRHNILLSGGGGQIRGLNKRIEDGLDTVGGGTVTVVEEPLFSGATGALQLALDMPSEYWQQLQ